MRHIWRNALAVLGASSLGIAVLTACQPPDALIRVPTEYKSYFEVAAKRCPGVLTPASLAAQASTESSFDSTATSPAGAHGMMQIIPEVWETFGTDADGDGYANPFAVPDSVATSAKFSCYLNKHLANIDGDPTILRLAAYNAGLGAVQKYGGVPPYRETQNYVERVQSRTEVLEAQFEDPPTNL